MLRRLTPLLVLAASGLGCNSYELFRVSGYEQASFSNEADIIFIIDNSSSMTDEAEDLALNFDTFIQDLTGRDLPTEDLSDAVDNYIVYTGDRASDLDYQLAVTTTSVDDSIDVPGAYGALTGDTPIISDSDEGVAELFSYNLLCEATCWNAALLPSDPGYECGTDPDQITLEYLDCLCGFEEWEGNCGAGSEEPLEAAVMSLCRAVEEPPDECYDSISPFGTGDELTNQGMLREDATTIFVVVTDEGDGSRRLTSGENDPSPYVDILDEFDLRYRFAVIGPNYDPEAGSLDCNSGGATTWGSERLQYMASVSGGFYNSISEEGAGGDCVNTDFAQHLDDLGALLESLDRSFPLQAVPDVATIVVYVDQEEVPGAVLDEEATASSGQEVYGDGWTYDASQNAIYFHGNAVPDYNQDVEIYYRPLDGTPRTLPF